MSPDAAYFDQWYADIGASPAKDDFVRRMLDLPAELQSSSLLTGTGLGDVVEALALSPDDLLLDLACGRGGYGLEIALRTGARLIGVDFSAVAVEQARARVAALGLPERARFAVGALEDTGLDVASVDAVLCVDAIQFAQPPADSLRECRRVLVAGGRLVLTCWEAVVAADDRVPVRLRQLHLERDLVAAGFVDVAVTEKPAWRAAERAMWEAAVAAEPGEDAAMRSLHDEGIGALQAFDALRRVIAVATAP